MTKITTAPKPIVYDLVNATTGEVVRKFPASSPKGQLTLLRFTAPSHSKPFGQIVAKGYPAFEPCKIGMSIRPREIA